MGEERDEEVGMAVGRVRRDGGHRGLWLWSPASEWGRVKRGYVGWAGMLRSKIKHGREEEGGKGWFRDFLKISEVRLDLWVLVAAVGVYEVIFMGWSGILE